MQKIFTNLNERKANEILSSMNNIVPACNFLSNINSRCFNQVCQCIGYLNYTNVVSPEHSFGHCGII